MALFQIIGLSLGVVLAYMAAIWLVSLALRNASIVDVLWGLGFALLAGVYFVAADGFIGRKILTSLVVVWQPNPDDGPPDAGVRGGFAGEGAGADQASIPGLHRGHQRLSALVPPPAKVKA